MRRRNLLLGLAGGCSLPAFGAAGPSYPNRAVTLVLGWSPGGGGDLLAHFLSQRLAPLLGHPVVPEHRPGAAGARAARSVFHAPGDGHTLLLADSSLSVAHILHPESDPDPVRFAPVSALGYLSYALVVSADSPVTTTAALLASLKARPGQDAYGSPGVGSLAHIATELMQQRAGTQALHVPYNGGRPMLSDLISQRLAFGMLSLPLALEQAAASRLRLLAVTSRDPSPATPLTPTLAGTLPGFHLVSSVYLLAAPQTAPARTQFLHQRMAQALAVPQAQQALLQMGFTPRLDGPRELTVLLRQEVEDLHQLPACQLLLTRDDEPHLIVEKVSSGCDLGLRR